VGINRTNGFTCLHYAISCGNYGFIKKLCRAKAKSEELAILLSAVNTKQPLTPLQYLNSKEMESVLTEEMRNKIENVLKTYGASEKRIYSEIVKEGYLTKQGHLVKNWKKRWFVLKHGYMQYFKNIQKLKEPSGTISLRQGSIAKTFTKNCFVVYDAQNDKKYFITAGSDEEMSEWFEAISFCIRETQ